MMLHPFDGDEPLSIDDEHLLAGITRASSPDTCGSGSDSGRGAALVKRQSDRDEYFERETVREPRRVACPALECGKDPSGGMDDPPRG